MQETPFWTWIFLKETWQDATKTWAIKQVNHAGTSEYLPLKQLQSELSSLPTHIQIPHTKTTNKYLRFSKPNLLCHFLNWQRHHQYSEPFWGCWPGAIGRCASSPAWPPELHPKNCWQGGKKQLTSTFTAYPFTTYPTLFLIPLWDNNNRNNRSYKTKIIISLSF